MRIAVWHNLISGGAKRALHHHVHGLVGRGHTVTAFCPPTADQSYLPLIDAATEEVLPLVVPDLSPVQQWLFRRAQADARTLARIRAMDSHAQVFAARVAQGNYDVVFANSCSWFYTPFAGRYVRLPSVLYLQEPFRPLYEARPALPWVAENDLSHPWWRPAAIRHHLGSAIRLHPRRVQAREELKNIRAFDRVLANSYFSRESILRTFDTDASVCYLGVDTNRFLIGDDNRDAYALSVGEFSSHKNPLFLVHAVGASRRKPRLVWAANRIEPDLLDEAQWHAAVLGVTLDVRSMVSEEELVALYQRASVLLYSPRLEPFGLVTLEAESCGTPVIAVAEGGVRETVEDMKTGLVVDGESQQMGVAIDRLFADPSLARTLGHNGAACVRQRWTWEAAIDRLEGHLFAVAGVPDTEHQVRYRTRT